MVVLLVVAVLVRAVLPVVHRVQGGLRAVLQERVGVGQALAQVLLPQRVLQQVRLLDQQWFLASHLLPVRRV